MFCQVLVERRRRGGFICDRNENFTLLTFVALEVFEEQRNIAFFFFFQCNKAAGFITTRELPATLGNYNNYDTSIGRHNSMYACCILMSN